LSVRILLVIVLSVRLLLVIVLSVRLNTMTKRKKDKQQSTKHLEN
jgi:hypothetical protein